MEKSGRGFRRVLEETSVDDEEAIVDRGAREDEDEEIHLVDNKRRRVWWSSIVGLCLVMCFDFYTIVDDVDTWHTPQQWRARKVDSPSHAVAKRNSKLSFCACVLRNEDATRDITPDTQAITKVHQKT